MLWTISSGSLWFVVVLISLSQLGVNIGPILAGAGVVGLAVGFGAQHLVRDLVSGFFLMLENQIRVGDVAIINGTGGSGGGGHLSHRRVARSSGCRLCFSQRRDHTLANATMDWSAYVIDVTISYNEDPDRVIDIMRRVADDMKRCRNTAGRCSSPSKFSGSTISPTGRRDDQGAIQNPTGAANSIGREFRRRLKKAFDTESVDLPRVAPRPANARSGNAASGNTHCATAKHRSRRTRAKTSTLESLRALRDVTQLASKVRAPMPFSICAKACNLTIDL